MYREAFERAKATGDQTQMATLDFAYRRSSSTSRSFSTFATRLSAASPHATGRESRVNSLWGWIGFNVVVLAILALDLGVLHQRGQEGLRQGSRDLERRLGRAVALASRSPFTGTMGKQSGLEFLTGYLIEYALSVDNIFVFVLIFSYFRVPEKYQHRVLFWGIIGALVLRGVMIVAGSALVTRFAWTLYIFGAFLVFTGIRMAIQKDDAGLQSRARSGAAAVAQADSGDATTFTATSSSFARPPEAGGDPSRRDTAVHRAGHRRHHRHHLRHRFDSRDLRRHPRSVHRLHIEHLRGPRPARALFPPRRRRRQVRLPEARTVARPDLHRREDAPRALHPHSDRRCPWSCGARSGIGRSSPR